MRSSDWAELVRSSAARAVFLCPGWVPGVAAVAAGGLPVRWGDVNTNTTAKQDIILGIVIFLLGFVAVAFAWGSISYLTAAVSWIAGVFMVGRGIVKSRK